MRVRLSLSGHRDRTPAPRDRGTSTAEAGDQWQLLALADGPRHGHSIMQEVAARTDGHVPVAAEFPAQVNEEPV